MRPHRSLPARLIGVAVSRNELTTILQLGEESRNVILAGEAAILI